MILLGGSLKNNKIRIAFRVDASSEIGTGHIVRCLTLANALKEQGAHIRFISRHMPEYFQQLITDYGYDFNRISSLPDAKKLDALAHSKWLGTSQKDDAELSKMLLNDYLWDWLVVDHYALDNQWESKLREIAKKILVIDDIADRIHDCDILLDQNLYSNMESRYVAKVPAGCQILLGPRYALLRGEFKDMRKKAHIRNDSVKNLLVFFGGMDVENYTTKTIQAIVNLKQSTLKVNVVIGAHNSHRKKIELQCIQHGFACHVQTGRMAELMLEADLSIGAGGSAVWERCCLGLPTLTICVAENQSRQLQDAALEGILYAPECKKDLVLFIQRHIHALIENTNLRASISRNGMNTVDGLGIDRVINAMNCRPIEIRPALFSDCYNLFEWRNYSSIREASRNTEIIKWEDHQAWISTVLNDPKRFLLIGELEKCPVGVVRFDVENDQAEISIYLVPDAQFEGKGRQLLQSAENWLMKNYPTILCINAHVLKNNIPSKNLFLKAGYHVESTHYVKRLH